MTETDETREGEYEAMSAALEKSGIRAPSLPDSLRIKIERRGPFCWSTREQINGMYTPFDQPLLEAVSPRVSDYASFRHIGHGDNSYLFSLHIVYGHLALLVGTGWGGVYMDEDKSTRRLNDQLGRCADLLAEYERSRQDLDAESSRLVVVEDELGGQNFAQWLELPVEATTPRDVWRQLDADGGEGLREPATRAAMGAISAAAAS